MPKVLLHHIEARRALARGVQKLAAAVESTLGPKGMNAMVDRPIGTPIVSRDGVTIASEIELPDRFENMGAQVVREVSMHTNEVAGDGTTTAMVLANGLIQGGVAALERGAKAVDLCKGIDRAVEVVVEALKSSAIAVSDRKTLEAVATIASTDAHLGGLIAEAVQRVGKDGIISSDYGLTTSTTLEVVEGMSFDRGYISHHMVTDVEKMEVVLDQPYILLTDLKIKTPAELAAVRATVASTGRPLVIVAEEIAPEVVVTLLGDDNRGKILVVNPPDYGHWRKAMMDDLAIITGGRVIARELGGRLEEASLADLGTARQVRASARETVIIRGGGDDAAIAARRLQVAKQHDLAPPNIEQDKLKERLAKLSGGTAVILAGGVTPVEQKRTIQLIDDALSAARAAAEEGIVPGGGTALAQCAPVVTRTLGNINGDLGEGIKLVRETLSRPAAFIARNAGHDAEKVVADLQSSRSGVGFDAANGVFIDMVSAGIVDPVRVTYTALRNAASVATLVLTTNTLIADVPEYIDPTQGPALGGGAEKLGRA
ncbi:chaperonin GroEL [Bradyrhizobium pachyrhizi]|uniref:60 kDa chaperonin n=1 Tax=Bradyrhizobium pachyrhizi TaxID=280333 RepID=A0A844SKY9_9BRAD|nr:MULTISPECIES: molecular chaperone GroEL [Bradyrhizobium]MVT64604.1 chaperonin GroEL [Bradyrhizobium pachyrhizi]WFU59237.1 molecular chaperone GroEL [Bradyrhizobium pachyrhizi]WOH84560.1 molecular chaperone GroEL [Bradyrhizobium sp. BEA-2-5]